MFTELSEVKLNLSRLAIRFLFFFILPFSLGFSENPVKDFFVKPKTEEQPPSERRAYESSPQESSCCEECICFNSCLPRDCMNGLLIRGEYLYWRPWQDGLAIAGTGTVYPGNIKHTDFDWTHGFKVAIGARFCDNWTLEVGYTYLRPTGKRTISDEEIFPIFMPAFVAGGLTLQIDIEDPFAATSAARSRFTKAASDIKLDYDVINVELHRNVSCFDCFDFEVIAGAQGVRVKEKLNIGFLGTLVIDAEEDINTPLQESLPTQIDETQTWKFEGGGIKVGGIGTYRSCCGFLLYGGGQANLLFGRYRNAFERSVGEIMDPLTIPQYVALYTNYYTIDGKERFCDFVTNFQFELGLGLEGKCGCFYYRLTAGWEMDYWLDLVQFRKGLTGQAAQVALSPLDFDVHFSNTNVTSKIGENLGLQGLVVSLEFTF